MAIEFIYTDSIFNQEGYLKDVEFDIDIGKYGVSQNDFELVLTDIPYNFDVGSIFYCEGTEYGGMIQYKKIDTRTNKYTYYGKTYRGLLEKEYIQPNGADYLVLNGEVNTILQSLIKDKFDGLFVVDDVGLSGIQVNYKVRDLNLLDTIERMLSLVDAKLEITIIDGRAHIRAVKIQDLSDLIRYDSAYQVFMRVETQKQRHTHILALGKGELVNRLRVNLYLQIDGSWSSTNELYKGLERYTYKYEDVNVSDVEELKANAIKKVQEIDGTSNLEISFDSDNANLFDIVGAKEEITGISFKEPITQKIIKGNLDDHQIDYKVGDN